jgi:hypothetical protein
MVKGGNDDIKKQERKTRIKRKFIDVTELLEY